MFLFLSKVKDKLSRMRAKDPAKGHEFIKKLSPTQGSSVRSMRQVADAVEMVEEFSKSTEMVKKGGILMCNRKQFIAYQRFKEGLSKKEAKEKWEVDSVNIKGTKIDGHYSIPVKTQVSIDEEKRMKVSQNFSAEPLLMSQDAANSVLTGDGPTFSKEAMEKFTGGFDVKKASKSGSSKALKSLEYKRPSGAVSVDDSEDSDEAPLMSRTGVPSSRTSADGPSTPTDSRATRKRSKRHKGATSASAASEPPAMAVALPPASSPERVVSAPVDTTKATPAQFWMAKRKLEAEVKGKLQEFQVCGFVLLFEKFYADNITMNFKSCCYKTIV